MTDAGMTVTRWRRFGHDRLYVADADAVQIGWWDLVAAEAHPEVEGREEDLLEAVRRWQGGHGKPIALAPPPAEPAAPVEPVPEPPPVEAVRPWIDLATNHPGSAAREVAESARRAAPVRTVLARVLGVHTTERAWRIGADGEEKVAARLAKLVGQDPRWKVLHAIPVGTRGADIDHLVIGPGGVFTINTKHHPDATVWVGGSTVMVNGTRQPYVRNSRHEAARAGTLLGGATGFPVHVEGVIAIVGAVEVEVMSQPKDVWVVKRRDVVSWLRRHGEVLDDERVEAIHAAARRSTTWRP